MIKKKESVPPGNSSCDKDPDRKKDTRIVVINGLHAIQMQDAEYGIEHLAWERACAHVRASFKHKTSRSKKNGKEYVTERWYRVFEDGSMQSTGSDKEPDYAAFYPPEPKPRYGFTVWICNSHNDEHIVIEEEVYKDDFKLFKDCLAFRLEDCVNFMHPMFKNPDKFLSVRVPNAAGSSGEDRNDPDWQFRPMLTGVINIRPDKDNGGSCEYYEAGV